MGASAQPLCLASVPTSLKLPLLSQEPPGARERTAEPVHKNNPSPARRVCRRAIAPQRVANEDPVLAEAVANLRSSRPESKGTGPLRRTNLTGPPHKK